MTVINASNVMLPVTVDIFQLTICKKKPKVTTLKVWWPILRMTSWIEILLQHHPQVLLCGFQLDEAKAGWKRTLRQFWKDYRRSNPDHEIFSEGGPPLECSIPYYLHGDEGRFLRSKPLMIEAFQVAISHKGMSYTNESGIHVSMINKGKNLK